MQSKTKILIELMSSWINKGVKVAAAVAQCLIVTQMTHMNQIVHMILKMSSMKLAKLRKNKVKPFS